VHRVNKKISPCGWFHKDVNHELSVDLHSGKVHAWAAVSVRGKVELVTHLLITWMLYFTKIYLLKTLSPMLGAFILRYGFQQDNDSKHTAGSTQTFF